MESGRSSKVLGFGTGESLRECVSRYFIGIGINEIYRTVFDDEADKAITNIDALSASAIVAIGSDSDDDD